MLGTAMMLMDAQAPAHYAGAPAPIPNCNNQSESGLGCYETAHGKLMLSAFDARQHERLRAALNGPDFAALSSWDEKHTHANTMREVLIREFATRSVDDLELWLHGLGIPVERAHTIDESLGIVEKQRRRLTAELPMRDSGGKPARVPLAPSTLSRGTAQISSTPPRFGEHTEAVLSRLGCDPETILALRARRAV